ncbi:small ribosomal subunit protein uS14m isoform X1 [Phascolarctos cinereus]|uniref:28S ribosomal protein S14, mitochondrial n=1 Tax=Phascolarctos cinereus TaxID=38626 RepID=A0A6P5J4T3_PHACI|nr:28S ribosomal protein S14, mitochondrial isoform X1 [Phascolarctos cinereus]
MSASVSFSVNKVAHLGARIRQHGGLHAVFSAALRTSGTGQIRSYHVDWRMLRDVKRRKMAFEFADERLRINSLRKNTILPKDLQEVADQEIAAFPRDSCPVRIRNRCVMTSRPRGVKRRWRISRIVFRHLADHGQLSGVQRAIW